MGIVVVDPSAIAAVIFGEEDRVSVAQRLAGQVLLAPSLIVFELVNIAIKKCKLGLLSPEQAIACFAEFAMFGIELQDVDMALCLRAALRHKLTAYDASYLCVARSAGAELVTLGRAASDG